VFGCFGWNPGVSGGGDLLFIEVCGGKFTGVILGEGCLKIWEDPTMNYLLVPLGGSVSIGFVFICSSAFSCRGI